MINALPFPFGFGQNRSGQVEALHSLLSSYYFLYANVRHGLLHHLREAYSLCGERAFGCLFDGRHFVVRENEFGIVNKVVFTPV